MQLLFDNGDEHVGGHGAPDLGLHRVLAGTQETLDAQVLLDPFEEQFHLPTMFVPCGDGQRRQARGVGQKHQRLARIGILKTNTPQMFGVVLRHVKPVQCDALIAEHPGGPVGLGRIHAASVHAALGSGDKERPRLMQRVESRKVEIAAIHDVKGPGLERHDVEHIDIAQLAVADVDAGRNVAAQIQQRVHLHGRVGAAKRCPIEHRQAQVDGGGIECVDGVVQLDAKILVAVELARPSNEQCGDIGPEVPVAPFVGIGQGRATHGGAQSHVVELARIGRETPSISRTLSRQVSCAKARTRNCSAQVSVLAPLSPP